MFLILTKFHPSVKIRHFIDLAHGFPPLPPTHACRDSLLASLLDGVRASGNRDVCVKMAPTRRGQRWGLLSMPVDEEVESLHLKFLAAPPSESPLVPLVAFMNPLCPDETLPSVCVLTAVFNFSFEILSFILLYCM